MDLKKLTSNVKQIQDDVLKEILTLSANTEYLRGYLHGSCDKELFKKNVPVVSYDDVKPYIERVVNGEPSDVISGKPITRFLLSSGTTAGKQKIFPVNNKFFEDMSFIIALRLFVISKHFEGGQKGKALTLFFTRPQSTTPCGLPISTSFTGYLLSDSFKNRPSNCFTSPDEVTLCPDNKQTMYCHLLCGLRLRDEVVNVTATFASSLVGAITFLESYWKEMCSNIRNGHVSEWITDLSCRDAVTNILGGGNSELADRIEKECNTKSWEGIFTRLWPKVKFIQSTVTGQNSQCIPMLEFYSNNVPLISTVYASSETMFGINMNPFCKPQDVSYTFIPTLSYFEFILADEGNKGEIVDLVNVKIGSYYEPLITNYYGLHRYRMGDILQVSGFYNDAPQFRFVRRKNVALSVSLEVTTEEDILKALNNATLVLKSSDLVLMGFTCYADISTLPGHYIFYWELKSKTISDIVKLDNKVLVECCCVMEESLCALYRELRSKDGDDFGEFAKFAFSEYGHRVKHWITINEPYESSLGGYDTAEKAPGRCSKYVNEKCVGGDSGHEVYTLSHNLLLAHTEAVEEFRKCAKCKDGNIGIVRSPMWFEPYEKKSSSEEIVKRALDFTLGWHLESVTQGDYPLTMKDSVVTSAFVAHVDNVNQEKPSCEFSLQITFTKSRWVQDWFSGYKETLGEKDVLQDALSDSNMKYYHMRHLRTLGGAFRDTCQAYSQNRPTNGHSFLGKVSLPGTSFVPYSDAGILHFPMEKRGVQNSVPFVFIL
ncbi:unnamed protein product [Brassica napus]|uniref:thioglucosidase n=1 Tax=Brassica napus TaxID=3708 RepID=A0A816J1E6_BRANA|nr:unnamed protein product [Brassica napus]